MMMKAFENHLPRRIHFGRGVSALLPVVLQALGVRRLCLITDQGVVAAGLLRRVTEPLGQAGFEFAVFDRVEPEPPFACVEQAQAQAIVTGGVDGVVGLGGGSVMDVAKVLAAVLADGRDVRSLAGVGKVGSRVLPVVMLPTTAGTGSEATPVAIFTDTATGGKVGVVDSCLVPDAALVDPALTDSLPPGVTAAAGIDALIHALEAFIATVATPLARGLALEAARHIGPALPLVCREPGNRDARDEMALRAHLAGVAFANSSCCAVHALALPVGGRFHIPHGVLTGGLAAAVMRRNIPACETDFVVFAAALGWGQAPAAEFVRRLETLAEQVGVGQALRRVPVTKITLQEMVLEAAANHRLMKPNPVALTVADVVSIYEETLEVT